MKRKNALPEWDEITHTRPTFLSVAWLPIAAAFLFTTLFWVFLAALAAIAVIGAVYAQKKRKDALGISKEEEVRLWREVATSKRSEAAQRSRELVSNLSAYREERASATEVADDARSVMEMFRTLRKDQVKQPTPAEASGAQEAVPTGITSHTSQLFSEDIPLSHITEASIQGPPPHSLSPPAPPGPTTMPRDLQRQESTWGTIPPPTRLTATQPWPDLAPHDELPLPGTEIPGAWPEALEEMPFQIRMDITDRLEADLEWIDPERAPSSAVVPGFLQKTRAKAQTKQYERLNRQVELTKILLHADEPELRKQGVQLAVRLEEDLHKLRAKREKRDTRK
jgi:hypothetical protein